MQHQAVKCLLSISVSRSGYVGPRQKEILNQLKIIFPTLSEPCDHVAGQYKLSQLWYEVNTYVYLNDGVLDMPMIALNQSRLINQLFLNHEIDIVVHYLYDKDKNNVSLAPHDFFGPQEDIDVIPYTQSRLNAFNDEIEKLLSSMAIGDLLE